MRFLVALAQQPCRNHLRASEESSDQSAFVSNTNPKSLGFSSIAPLLGSNYRAVGDGNHIGKDGVHPHVGIAGALCPSWLFHAPDSKEETSNA